VLRLAILFLLVLLAGMYVDRSAGLRRRRRLSTSRCRS
jgi:hypothetical protein